MRILNSNQAFTLIELLIVMSAAIIIAALVLPVGIRFYLNQSLDETAFNTLESLRRAQANATYQKNDSAFGVFFTSSSFTLYQGSSFATRVQNEDELFTLPAGITTSGLTEVNFAKLTGLPNATSTLAISNTSASASIGVSNQGKIEIE